MKIAPRSERSTHILADASEKYARQAFCDKEMSETKAKRDDKQSDLDDLNTKIDKATSRGRVSIRGWLLQIQPVHGVLM